MKNVLIILLIFLTEKSNAQELFVSTEPASNMASGSIGLRLNSKLFQMNHDHKFNRFRIDPEVMLGVNKKLMLHLSAYGSDMFQDNFRFEGVGLYGKYRFFSQDDVHEHLRFAAFAKVSAIKNPQVLITTAKHKFPDGNGGYIEHVEELHVQSNEIDLDGNNSGFTTGLIATKLKNKLAISASVAYAKRFDNIHYKTEIFQPIHAVNYTASAGYLLFPREYINYTQLNFNFYIELLGENFIDKSQSYLDAAPAIQFIINSIARVDIAYRTQLRGNVNRMSTNYFMLRLEYNLLNAFGKK